MEKTTTIDIYFLDTEQDVKYRLANEHETTPSYIILDDDFRLPAFDDDKLINNLGQ